VNDDDRDTRNTRRMPKRTDPAPTRPAWLNVPDKEWDDTWIAVTQYAQRITKKRDRAEDIRQEAYLRLLTTRPWKGEGAFMRHMLLVAKSLLMHENEAHESRKEYEALGGAEYKRERGSATPSGERDLLEEAERRKSQDRAGRALAELRRRLAGHSLELRLIDRAEQAEASEEELPTPAELANEWRINVAQIYRARERIQRYKDSVYAAVDGEGDGTSPPLPGRDQD
jgi:DNA-directed RNA polymerase specialized sigma24 family protein